MSKLKQLTSLYCKVKQKPWEYLCTCNLTWLNKRQPITTLLLRGLLAFPGELSNELWCQGTIQPPAAGQPQNLAGHEDIWQTPHTQPGCALPPATPGYSWSEQCPGFEGSQQSQPRLCSDVSCLDRQWTWPQRWFLKTQWGENNQFPFTQLNQMSNIC